ncbi:glycogen debranching protein GlgX [Rhodocytophaga aerolata]|uniref:Glycogen debranching protein GlgX n=1 Tax=Rhodocytophaga aerolata TaxID=455078 RepID=A0ABT8RAB8_9BACT|nr:glycogen debranching protein GlgX [Rhodocytophaga aerolata]MDO1449017.1 glycogen debranching protein GlgX [Rhodocytophaga aerolata]
MISNTAKKTKRTTKKTKLNVWIGKPYPLGATWDGDGVNFALFSESATKVELCLFNSAEDSQESVRIRMREQTDYVWHCYIPGLKPGQLYGYRVYGPHHPEHGQRFNPSKLLLDPYAKAITGRINWSNAMFGYPVESTDENRHLLLDTQDSAAGMNRSVVIDEAFDWGNDKSPNIPLNESIIYEVHVKGFTQLHPEIDPKIRGTYAALATPEIIDYLKKLGITAVELLPVHHFVHDKILVEKGLNNYWGYNTIGFFAPHADYSSLGIFGQQVLEFKAMVKTLHKAGIEVILDVVYNHTAEGNHYGPTLSFKGIDNQAYYRLVNGNPQFYMDYTGTGNTINMLHPKSLQMVMDSLRYWVTEMHVDGFRFDLASTLARGLHDVGKLSTFLDTIHQDPILSQVKLIAEPWDVGEGGYQVGNFPVKWAEWNGKYRDSVRRFWKGDESQVAELAYRLSGSSDLYQHNGRLPGSSINFITAHDGFTLNDLVSYNEKHNHANGENNNDGDSHNNSWNCGVEGPTDDEDIIFLREKQKRNFLATLFLSQGVPMLLHGDEYGRTQHGNNNVYCQDNETSWFNWEWTKTEQALFEFTSMIIKLRRDHPVLHRRKFFHGREIRGTKIKDIRWLRPDGKDMTRKEWHSSYVRCLGMLLNGQVMSEYDERSQRIKDDIFLLIVNSYWEPIDFNVPDRPIKGSWEIIIDTHEDIQSDDKKKKKINFGEAYTLQSRSLVLLRMIPKASKQSNHLAEQAE